MEVSLLELEFMKLIDVKAGFSGKLSIGSWILLHLGFQVGVIMEYCDDWGSWL